MKNIRSYIVALIWVVGFLVAYSIPAANGPVPHSMDGIVGLIVGIGCCIASNAILNYE